MDQKFIDIHCHPQIKPYGKSFSVEPIGKNSTNPGDLNSIWCADAPTTLEKKLEHILFGLPRFRESDFSTLIRGNVQVICAALYTIEKGFFLNRLGGGTVSEVVDNFVTCVGKDRVDFIQDIKDYFSDLSNEYDYYLQIQGKPVKIDSHECTYVLVKNFDDLERRIQLLNTAINTIFVVITIEGMHSLNNNFVDYSSGPDLTSVQANVLKIKSWEYPPFFVTVAHHFYNYLCGHAKSLIGAVGAGCDQTYGIDTTITLLGEQVIHALLDKKNGKRILIDIKHMSAIARKRYFEILEEDYKDEDIPVIVSHAACIGRRSADNPVIDGVNTGYKMFDEDINFYDDEIIIVAKTNGIFGLQLDKHRIADAQTRHNLLLRSLTAAAAQKAYASLLWNQVQHILELLDRNNLYAWDCIAIGSDYDGIINPMNGYLTADKLEDLMQNMESYITDYMNENSKNLLPQNRLSPADIVSRIFYSNALNFLQKYFV